MIKISGNLVKLTGTKGELYTDMMAIMRAMMEEEIVSSGLLHAMADVAEESRHRTANDIFGKLEKVLIDD